MRHIKWCLVIVRKEVVAITNACVHPISDANTVACRTGTTARVKLNTETVLGQWGKFIRRVLGETPDTEEANSGDS